MTALIVGLLSFGLIINLFLTMFGYYIFGYYVFLLFFIFWVIKHKNLKSIFSNKTNLIVLSIIIITSVLNIIFFSDYKFEGGHDQGVYAEHAAWIYKNHKFDVGKEFSNVLTFPGYKLINDKIVIHFPPLYPLYLSYFNFITPFTLAYKVSTAFLYILFLLLIYAISKFFIKNNILKIFLILLISTNYYTITIFRTTYVETFYSILLLCMTLSLLKMAKGNKYWFLIGLFAGVANCFTRSEGIANLIVYLLIGLIIFLRQYKEKRSKTVLITVFSALFLLFSAITCYLYISNYFNYLPTYSKSTDLVTGFDLGAGNYNIYLLYLIYFLNVIKPLGISFIFVIIFCMLLRIHKNKNIFQIIILVSIVLPQIIFIIIPGIAPYLPWYFRRIYPSIFIYSIMTFVVLLNFSNLFNQKMKSMIMAFLFIINLNFSASIMFYKESGTLDLVNQLSKYNDTSSSIVLIDRYGIENIAPLLFFYKNTYSVFDRYPIADKNLYNCLQSDIETIYVVSTTIKPSSYIKLFGSILDETNLIAKLNRSYDTLYGSCDIRKFLVDSSSFKEYSQIEDLCKANNPPKNRIVATNNVYIYKIKPNLTQNLKKCSSDTVSQLVWTDFIKEFELLTK